MGTVNIGASQGVYSLFSNYDYTEWQALAEFIDNSVSSWERLKLINSNCDELRVDIRFYSMGDKSADYLVIEDNAGGIFKNDLDRAFALAIPPNDKTRINQFGVGMKVAACWFAKDWVVESSAYGEDVLRRIEWSTKDIVANGTIELPTIESPEIPGRHFTRITLKNMIHSPRAPSTQKKIKSFIPKLYRKFIQESKLKIFFNDELLEFVEPVALVAKKARDPESAEIRWERNLEFSLACGLKVRGTAKLLATMSRQLAALNLFWRNRLIVGNVEPFYRPEELFGSPNSFRCGRLYIDLELNDFSVTTDKKSIDFGSSGTDETELLREIKKILAESDFPILFQGENYRAKDFTPDQIRPIADALSDTVATAQDVVGRFFDDEALADEPVPETADEDQNENTKVAFSATKKIAHTIDGFLVAVQVQCVNAGEDADWFTSRSLRKTAQSADYEVEINIQHPFIKKILTRDTAETLFGIIVSLVYGEMRSASFIADYTQRRMILKFSNIFLNYMAQTDLEFEQDGN